MTGTIEPTAHNIKRPGKDPGPLLLLISDFSICLLGKLRYVSDTTWLSQGIDDQVYSELQPSLTRVG